MRTFFLLLLLATALPVMAQEQYITEVGIQYYADSVNARDGYLASRCVLDIYYPKHLTNFATIVWFHGGGLTGGTKTIPKALMNSGYAVIGVEYRLSPLVRAPAYIEDAAAAVAWVFKNIDTYGGSSDLIFVAGHSAGAYLGMMITLDKKYLGKYNVDANKIAALIPLADRQLLTLLSGKKRASSAHNPSLINMRLSIMSGQTHRRWCLSQATENWNCLAATKKTLTCYG